MPTDVVEISSYEYYQYSSKDDDKAYILCEGVGGHLITLQFKGGTLPLPQAVKAGRGNPGQNTYILFFRYPDMVNILDMLRNEKPVYLKFDSGAVQNTRLSTSPAVIS
ncbi:MAG: hypothetical protein JSR62_04600 [Nitrospira sp.]|nr:hypothetical protein [Nitrospira sp.]